MDNSAAETLLANSRVVHVGGPRPVWGRLLTRAAFIGAWLISGMALVEGGKQVMEEFQGPAQIAAIAQWSPPVADPLPSAWFKHDRFSWTGFVKERKRKGLDSDAIQLQYRLLNMVANPVVFNREFRPTAAYAAGFEQRREITQKIIEANSEQFWDWWPRTVKVLEMQTQGAGTQGADYVQGVGLNPALFPDDLTNSAAWKDWASGNMGVLLAPEEILFSEVEPTRKVSRQDLQRTIEAAGLVMFSYPLILDTPVGREYLQTQIQLPARELEKITGWGPRALGLDGRISWNYRPSDHDGAAAHALTGEGLSEITSLPSSVLHEWLHGLSAVSAKSVLARPTTSLISDVWDSWSLRTYRHRHAWKDLHAALLEQEPSVLKNDAQVQAYVQSAKQEFPAQFSWVAEQGPEFHAQLLAGKTKALDELYANLRSTDKRKELSSLGLSAQMVWLWSAMTMEAGAPTANWGQRRALLNTYATRFADQSPGSGVNLGYYADPEEFLAAGFAGQYQKNLSPTEPLQQEAVAFAPVWGSFFKGEQSWWVGTLARPLRLAVSLEDIELPQSLRARLLGTNLATSLPGAKPDRQP